MNSTNTLRFEVNRLFEGVSSSTSIRKLYLKTSYLFTRLKTKPKKAEADMKEVESFLMTNRNIEALDLTSNEIDLPKADRFVEIMEKYNYTLKRFDIGSSTYKTQTLIQHAHQNTMKYSQKV